MYSPRTLTRKTPVPAKSRSALAKQKRWRRKHSKRLQRYNAVWMKANPAKAKIYRRRGMLKLHYNLTMEAYEALLSVQGGHCALCSRTPDQVPRGVLSVDHCHKTNRVRGLLCQKHNTGLGLLGDDKESLLRALAYIERSSQCG